MTDSETCEAYGIDPNDHNAPEAVDRIEQLKRYGHLSFLAAKRLDSGSTFDFDFRRERSFTDETMTWAMQHEMQDLVSLAESTSDRLVELEAFAQRLIARAHKDGVEQYKEDPDQ